jgi:hypothetical protein
MRMHTNIGPSMPMPLVNLPIRRFLSSSIAVNSLKRHGCTSKTKYGAQVHPQVLVNHRLLLGCDKERVRRKNIRPCLSVSISTSLFLAFRGTIFPSSSFASPFPSPFPLPSFFTASLHMILVFFEIFVKSVDSRVNLPQSKFANLHRIHMDSN